MPDNLFPEEYENEEEYFEDEGNEGIEEENTEDGENAGYKPSVFFDFNKGDFVINRLGKGETQRGKGKILSESKSRKQKNS